jgi:hypothetical protein
MAGSRCLPAVNGFGYLARIDMNEAHEVRHWIEKIGCSEDELAAAVARVATPLMRYGVRFIDIGHLGHSRRQKYRDEDRASRG